MFNSPVRIPPGNKLRPIPPHEVKSGKDVFAAYFPVCFDFTVFECKIRLGTGLHQFGGFQGDRRLSPVFRSTLKIKRFLMLSFCNSCKRQVELVANSASGEPVCACCGAEMHMSSVNQLRRGTIINGFMIEGKLGQGGMGVVYKAKQLNLERYVALKVLSDELARDAEFVERFFKEARAAASLSHSNIVQVYDAGSTLDGIYYFAMELIEGETLDTRISRDGLLPQKDALDIAVKIASALDYAWEKQSLCHGDIKPDNIILNSSGGAKLADLGLAKSIHDENDFKEGVMATPLYAPPELISGDTHGIDCRSDMYSFGATLYHMLSGMPPFSGDDPETVMRKHLNEKPAPLSEVNRELNPVISNLVDHLLLKNPENRPASWKEICKSLDKIHDVERKVFHKPMQNAPKSSSRFQPLHPSGEQETSSDPLLKTIVALVAAVVILAVSIVAAYVYMNARNSGAATVQQGASPSASTPPLAEKIQKEWLKVKTGIAKTDPESGISLIQEYVKHYPSNIPPDADKLLQDLKQKLVSREREREDAKKRTGAIRKDISDLVALIAASDFKSMGKQKLEEFSKRIERNLAIVSKDAEPLIPPESRDKLNQAFLEISNILVKIKAEDEGRALAEQAEKEQERVDQEKRKTDEAKKQRQDKLAADNLLDGYYLLLGDIMSSYSKKKDQAYLKKLVETWLLENKKNTIPEFLMVKSAFLLNTVIPGEPLIFSILEKNEASLIGKNIPGNTSSLKISDEYLIDRISDKSMRLMTTMGKGKIGKTITQDQLTPDMVSQLLQQRILAPDSGVKPVKRDINAILAFYLLNGMDAQFSECLKNCNVFSAQEKKNWESAAEDMRLALGEKKVIELWREFTGLNKEGGDPEASRLLVELGADCKDTDFYKRHADEIGRQIACMGAYFPDLQALSLLEKAGEDMKNKQYLAALHKIMTAEARCGNMKNLRQSLRDQIDGSRKLCLDGLAAASNIKNMTENRIPFYYWEAETPGDAWIYEQIVRATGRFNNGKLASTIEIGSCLDYGNWGRAREILNSGKAIPTAKLTALKGNLAFWTSSFIFAQGLVNMNYNDREAQLNSLSAIQETAEHFKENPAGPMYSMSDALAIEYALMLHAPVEANDIAAKHGYSMQRPDREVRIALLHMLAILDKCDATQDEFSGLLKKYSGQFGQCQGLGSDFQWCKTSGWILEAPGTMDSKLLQLLKDSKCSAPDICARIMASAFAKTCVNGLNFNSGNELIPVLESKVNGNIASGGLWRKLAILKMSRSGSSMPEVIDNLMNDSRICAISFYPKLCIMKVGHEVMSGRIQAGAAVEKLRLLLDSSTIASDSDKKCIEAIISGKPAETVSKLISENRSDAAFWCGILGIMAHKKESAITSDVYGLLKENFNLMTWDERFLLEVLIK